VDVSCFRMQYGIFGSRYQLRHSTSECPLLHSGTGNVHDEKFVKCGLNVFHLTVQFSEIVWVYIWITTLAKMCRRRPIYIATVEKLKKANRQRFITIYVTVLPWSLESVFSKIITWQEHIIKQNPSTCYRSVIIRIIQRSVVLTT
jgi:hypothetical protein